MCAALDGVTLHADAVLITSSAWPTLAVIQALEDDLGKTGGEQCARANLGAISRPRY